MAAGAVAVAEASGPTELPRRLWELHRVTAVGEVVAVDLESVVDSQRRADLITGGGFEPAGVGEHAAEPGAGGRVRSGSGSSGPVGDTTLRRCRTLADTVGADLT